MKRLLQGLALVQLFLVVALGVRIVDVWRTPLPEAGEIPDLPAVSDLPPPRPPARIAPTVAEEIVANDLFDDERGKGYEEVGLEGGLGEEEGPPVPPPSSVKLMGVMFVDEEPVGFLLDTNLKPEQQSVRKGEMFGEYQVGDISATGLLLLGSGGQQFQIPLRVGAAGAAAAPAAAGARTPPRPASARPAQAQNRGGNAASQKTMTARERAQAIAKRNAEQRKNNARAPAGRAAEQAGGDEAPDPAEARLEALRQLREAAKNR